MKTHFSAKAVTPIQAPTRNRHFAVDTIVGTNFDNLTSGI